MFLDFEDPDCNSVLRLLAVVPHGHKAFVGDDWRGIPTPRGFVHPRLAIDGFWVAASFCTAQRFRFATAIRLRASTLKRGFWRRLDVTLGDGVIIELLPARANEGNWSESAVFRWI